MTRVLSLYRVGLLVAFLLVGIASALHTQTFTTFDVPNSTATAPAAINSRGQITGLYSDTTGSHGFLRESNGTFTSFDVPNIDPVRVELLGITSMNNAGQITGYFYMLFRSKYASFIRETDGTLTAVTEPPECFPSRQKLSSPVGSNIEGIAIASINNGGQTTGICGEFPPFNESFLRQADGTFVAFMVDGADMTKAQAINSRGQITGWYYIPGPGGGYHYFLRQPDGTITSFDVSNPGSANPTALNEKGEITGYADHAFVREPNGSIVTFDVPNSISTQPTAINPKGQITGTYLDASNAYHGFLREMDGSIITFDVPNATNTNPTGINPRGDITGSYSDASGGVHGFVRGRQCRRR